MLLDASVLLDVVAVALVVLAAVGGWRRGGTGVALHAAGMLAGLVVGLRLALLMGTSLSPVAHVLLGVLCAVGGLLIGGATGRWIGGRVAAGVARAHLGIVDRTLGALTRGLGAALAIWIVLAIVVALGPAGWAATIRRASPGGSAGVVPVVGPVGHDLASAVSSAAPGDVAALVPDLDPGSVPSATVSRVDALVRDSVFEIGANRCSATAVGTAFVAARTGTGALVVTNDHVVRGASAVMLHTDAGDIPAVPLVLDRRADLAILRVDGLTARALPLAVSAASNGTHAVTVGYPHGGPRRAVGAVIVQRLPVPDPGLSDGFALHLAYRISADIEHGDSGSPLVDRAGRVLGVVNATAGAGTDQGYAITSSELRPDLRTAQHAAYAAPQRRCS